MKKLLVAAMVTLLGLSFVGVSTVSANMCGPVGTGTPGYWMNHPEAWPMDIDGFYVDGVFYSKEEVIDMMKDPVKGDKWLTLFPAFVAATLNVAIGNCPPTCYTLAEVEWWIDETFDERPIRASSERWQASHGEALYWCLDGYNNGLLPGIPSRDALE